jgi:hypothetical protein
MSLADLSKTVAKYAPLLGAVLPIPGGAVLGKVIADVFGGDVKNTEDLVKRIEGDPDAAIKIKTIESNERIEIEKLIVLKHQVEIENEVKDRDSARKFAVNDIKTARNLTYLLVVASITMILLIPFLNPDGRETSLMAALITMLVQAAKDAIRTWFGRSFKEDS